MAGKKGSKINREECKKFKEYYKKYYPNLSDDECIELANKYKRSCNYQCIEYYEKRYPELSHAEHLQLKEQLQKQRRSNKDTNIEYWIKRYPGESLDYLEQLRKNAAKEKNKCDIEYWIKRYPNKTIEETTLMHKEFYEKWLSHQNGWGKGNDNPNSKANTTQEERNSKSPRNIAFYEKRYPELSHEEHQKMLNNFFEKNRNAVKNAIKPTNIEYYLNLGMSYEEAKKSLSERQSTFTLEKCIKKYGEELGIEKFYKRQQKWVKKLQQNFKENGDGRSIQSIFGKTIIKDLCKQLNIDIPKKEKYFYDKEYKRAYAYDFSYNNKIIEFNGDYWHCNPRIYDKEYFNKTKQMYAKDIWEYDKRKLEVANEYSNDVLTIWEYDYNDDYNATIKKCIDFLLND